MTGRPQAPLRVALIGYGLAGRVFHAPLIATTADLVLDTVVTSAPARRDQAVADHPGVRLAETADDVWARADALDLVVVATTNRSHVPLAQSAIGAGLPVVVDKPMAGRVSEAQELADMAEGAGLMLAPFHNRRWDADFLTLSSLLEAGALGDVWRFESRFERWRPERTPGWRDSPDPDDVGGLLYDLGSHLVDQALVLFGPVRTVYAERSCRRPGPGADDDTFIALEHQSGVRSHLWMSATAATFGPRFRVLGSKEGFVKYGLDPQEAALRQGERPGRGWGTEDEQDWGWLGSGGIPGQGRGRAVPSLPGNYPAFYRGVAQSLLTGCPPPVAAADAVEGLRVLEAAATSARETRVETLGGTSP